MGGLESFTTACVEHPAKVPWGGGRGLGVRYGRGKGESRPTSRLSSRGAHQQSDDAALLAIVQHSIHLKSVKTWEFVGKQRTLIFRSHRGEGMR
jgi:hypothetical protein